MYAKQTKQLKRHPIVFGFKAAVLGHLQKQDGVPSLGPHVGSSVAVLPVISLKTIKRYTNGTYTVCLWHPLLFISSVQ